MTVMREHSHGGGVYNDRCVGVKTQIVIIVFSGAGDHNRQRTLILQHRNHCIGCAAAAKNQWVKSMYNPQFNITTETQAMKNVVEQAIKDCLAYGA